MSLQQSVAVRNARLDAIESTIGASALLRIYDGAVPADCAAGIGGSNLLVAMALPADWMNAASGGSKTKSGTWEDTSADNTGTASYFRIYDNGFTDCHMQGTVTATGGGGDLQLNTVSIVGGQTVSITGFTITAGNA